MNEPKTIEFEIVPADAGLAEPQRHMLVESFAGFFEEAAKWKRQTENITDAKVARTARLELKKIRVNSDKTRKALKEDSLRLGRAIDGAYNILLNELVPIEKRMEEVEKQEERRKAEALARLIEERMDTIAPYLDPDMPPPYVGAMTEDQFAKFLSDAKLLAEAKVEAARKAEEERIAREKAAAEERERVRLENERLKAEAAAKEAELKAEREAAAKAAAEAEEKAKAEAEKRDAELRAEREKAAKIAAEAEARAKAERDRLAKEAEKAAAKARKEREAAEAKARKEREALEAKLAAERAEKERALAEAKAREEAEAKARLDALAEQERAAAKAAAAPDREKILAFAATVESLEVPAMASPEGKEAAKQIAAKVKSFAEWIKDQAP